MSGVSIQLFGEPGERYRDRYHRYMTEFHDHDVIADASSWVGELLSKQAAPDLGWKNRPAIGVRATEVATPSVDALLYHAPVALIEGAWLQSINRPTASSLPTVCKAFRAYLELLGPDIGGSPANAYRGMLASRCVKLPATRSIQFANYDGAGEIAFAWGAMQLALGIVGYARWEELLGFSLAYGESSSPWRLSGIAGLQRSGRLLQYLTFVRSARDLHLAHVSEQGSRDVEDRIGKGYALYCQAEREYLAALSLAEGGLESLSDRVARIFAAKAAVGSGYHQGKSLGGCPMDQLLSGKPVDAVGLMTAFAASPWSAQRGGYMEFRRLTDFGGPMFGVFSEEELATIDRWLTDGGKANLNPADSKITNSLAVVAAKRSRRSSGTLKRRELFHRLVNEVADELTHSAARRYLEIELRRAGCAVAAQVSRKHRFFEYSPNALEDWVRERHQAELNQHRPFVPPPRLTKEEYRWGMRQFAPSVLVDGCWLAGTGMAADQDDPVSRCLLKIYADELGAGEPTRHHPAIYRGLLADLAIDLPELGSFDFSHSPGFLDAAFDLPVYCLAIGRSGRDFLPEILGLNLAIELSGLGAQYLRLADELEYWGIDPLIVRLHQSIDNLASGHSALAVKAIQTFLDGMASNSGPESVSAAWRRIWTGYVSLHTVTKRFRWSLVGGFCMTFGVARWRAFWDRAWREFGMRTATL